jgi:hypothetical protein
VIRERDDPGKAGSRRSNLARWLVSEPVAGRLVVLSTLVTLALAAYAVRTGISRLSGPRLNASGHSRATAAASLWNVLLLAAAAGFLSYAVVEFIKRLTPMRPLFNRKAVRISFPELAGSAAGEEPANASPPPAAASEHAKVRPSTPSTVLGITYSGTIQQVAAQVADRLRRQHPQLSPARTVTDQSEEEQIWLEILENRVDVFQIEATARWRQLLRALACFTSALLSAFAAWAVTSAVTAIVVAMLFGLIIGGPVAWFVRDLTRVAERKAEF